MGRLLLVIGRLAVERRTQALLLKPSAVLSKPLVCLHLLTLWTWLISLCWMRTLCFSLSRLCDLLTSSSLLQMAPGCETLPGCFSRQHMEVWCRPRTSSPFSAPNQPLTQPSHKGRMLRSRRRRRRGIKMLLFQGSVSAWMEE